MIELDVGNVLLKPSHRRQLSALLRSSLRLGRQLGAFDLTITMRRAGSDISDTVLRGTNIKPSPMPCRMLVHTMVCMAVSGEKSIV